jgi:hypothetical protein
MSFYKITQQPDALAIRLSAINPDKKFYPKWHVVGQNEKIDVAVTIMVPFGTLGLYLGEGTIHRSHRDQKEYDIDCYILLINDQRLYVPKQLARAVSVKEMEME